MSDTRPFHGGNLANLHRESGIGVKDIIDFSANLNPLGPPNWLRSIISNELWQVAHYPDPDCTELVEMISKRYGVDKGRIIPAAGATEIIHALPRAFGVKKAVIVTPTYTDYSNACQISKLAIKNFSTTFGDDFSFRPEELESTLTGGELVFICTPNNPTGEVRARKEIANLAKSNPDSFFVIDESFGGFIEEFESTIELDLPNVITIVSLTKICAIPGLRVGFGVVKESFTEKIKRLLPPWSVNHLAQRVATEALKDFDYLKQTPKVVRLWRNELITALKSINNIRVYEGFANYVLLKLLKGAPDSSVLFENLLAKRIAIRTCKDFHGLDSSYIRLAVRTPEENTKLVEALMEELGSNRKVSTAAKKRVTPAIMFQGVSSNAGKSVMATAFCRIFKQDGYKVAPFKAQNMSLNSYVTLDGKEIARAQVTQALACGVQLDVRMNPVLIKPNSDTGAQVLVRGEPKSNMSATEYVEFKKELAQIINSEYDSLADDYQIIVLEGAGSPAEVNLKRHDLVNMKMARHAKSPVIIVGDIDRGGVFGSFIGVMETLYEWERQLVAGFLINRFRGDPMLLGDANDYVLRHTGKPTFGVVHFLPDLGLPEEDMAFGSGTLYKGAESIDLALIALRHVSNSTDFDAFYLEPDVSVRIVRKPEELGTPDAVIIPGSKNVISDIKSLRDRGLDSALAKIYSRGNCEIIGVCGGFQILGQLVEDPHGIESSTQKSKGLGLLPITTRMDIQKTLQLVKATHLESGLKLEGYEIHHGVTDTNGAIDCMLRLDGKVIGYKNKTGDVWGTYLHGAFDSDEFRRWLIDRIRKRKGMNPIGHVIASYNLESALDRLADSVRQAVDMDQIYNLMNIK